MLDRDLLTRDTLRLTFERIEPLLYRYPAVSAEQFRDAVRSVLDG